MEKGVALHFNKLESHSQTMLCAKFGWNWPCDSGGDDQGIFAISYLSPAWKGHGLHLNKLESPSPKDALCQV